MTRRSLIAALVLLPVIIWIGSNASGWWHYLRLSPTDRAIARMDQGANLTVRFYGRVVDQDGRPISGAAIEIEIRAINENWAKEGDSTRRGRESHLQLSTDPEGGFQFEATGYLIKFTSITKPEYRWLYDLESGHVAGLEYACNWAYEVASHGKPGPYVSNAESPAVFVMVKDGLNDVRTKPSRGGMDYDIDQRRMKSNGPMWPHKPSISGLRDVEPSPSSEPAVGNS